MSAYPNTAINQWARDLLSEPERLVILDTETTGLKIGEIVEISLISGSGELLLDTYVKPSQPIPYAAIEIHGITNEAVSDAPTWLHVEPQVFKLLINKDVVVYNATYDRSMMHQSGERNGMEHVDWKGIARWHCAMLKYAEFWGEWGNFGSYRWQKLTDACRQQQIPEPQSKAHSALGDCLRTLALLNAMKEGRRS